MAINSPNYVIAKLLGGARNDIRYRIDKDKDIFYTVNIRYRMEDSEPN